MRFLNALFFCLLALILSPMLRSVINRTKAFFSGRRGPCWLQPYYDLEKLWHKDVVISHSTSWIFRASPIVGLAAALFALLLIPAGGASGLLYFEGDLVLFAYVWSLGRFFTMLAAMDTGSSFEGMGASREAFFSALAEPALLLGLAGLASATDTLSLSSMYSRLDFAMYAGGLAPALLFILLSFLIVYLTENARIPVDDPATHLELTMIHEVMILDHSGPDLAMIEYAGALKLWVLGLLISGLFCPVRSGFAWIDGVLVVAGLFLVAALVGVIESTMARVKLIRVPQLLAVAFALSSLWVIWIVR